MEDATLDYLWEYTHNSYDNLKSNPKALGLRSYNIWLVAAN